MTSKATSFNNGIKVATIGPTDSQQHTIPSNASDTLALLSASQTLANKTLRNPQVTNYTETVYVAPAPGTAFTVDLSLGTIHKFTTSGNTTITIPNPVAGKSFVVIISFTGVHTVTFVSPAGIRWASSTPPTATALAAKIDIFSFFQDGIHTYGATVGQNY